MSRANGQVERVKSFSYTILFKLEEDESLLTALEKAQFVINNTFHKSVASTPSRILLGISQKRYTDDELRDYIRAFTEIDPTGNNRAE